MVVEDSYTGNSTALKKVLKDIYEPITTTVYALYATRNTLLVGKGIKKIRSIPPCPQMFDNFSVMSCASNTQLPHTPNTSVPRRVNHSPSTTPSSYTELIPVSTPLQENNRSRPRGPQRQHSGDLAWCLTPSGRKRKQFTSTLRGEHTESASQIKDTQRRPRRIGNLSTMDLNRLIRDHDTDMLNAYAREKKIPGHDLCYLDRANENRGLCLRIREDIKVAPGTTFPLCTYTGKKKEIQKNEHIASIPIHDLIYGCEYTHKNRRFRLTPDGPMGSLVKFMNDPGPGAECNTKLLLEEPGIVGVHIITDVAQGDELLIDYGPYYWLNSWTRLDRRDQELIRETYQQVVYPPTWPTVPDPKLPDQRRMDIAEWEYAIASRNIYDTLENDSDSEDRTMDRADGKELDEEIYHTPIPLHSRSERLQETESRSDPMSGSTPSIMNYLPQRHCIKGWMREEIPPSADAMILALQAAIAKAADKVGIAVPSGPSPSKVRFSLRSILVSKMAEAETMED